MVTFTMNLAKITMFRHCLILHLPRCRIFRVSTLYLTATPIGNLEDITLRALRVLREVDVIACEDTRHTGQLLQHFEIRKRLIACHAHNEEASSKGILSLLDAGQNVAYCSDAGTPGVSDPGARLVEYVRSNSDHEIVPIPGASASVALVSVAGNIGRSFTFEGFLSPKKGRRTRRLEELVSRREAFIIYESPFRVLRTLKEIAEIDPSLRCVIGRELTKQFEEVKSGSITEIAGMLEARDTIKGEFAILIAPGVCDDQSEEDTDA